MLPRVTSRLAMGFLLAASLAAVAGTNDTGRFAYTAPEPLARTPASRGLGNWGHGPSRAIDLAKVVAEADQLARTGGWERATALVNDALDAFPDEPELLIRAGHYSEKRKAYLVADSYWSRIQELQPSNTWVQACRAVLVLRMGHTNEAEARLRAVLATSPDEMVARFHLACLLLGRGKSEEARLVLGEMNLTHTGQAAVWARDDADLYLASLGLDGYRTLCGFIASGGETPLPAVRERLAGLDSQGLRDAMDKIASALWQGMRCTQRNDWAGAIKQFRAASAAGFDAPAGYQGLAFALAQTGDTNNAVAIMARAIELFPASAYAHLKYGQICLELGRYSDALDALTRARGLDAVDDEILLGQVAALAALGRVDEAWRMLDAIPGPKRQSFEDWFNRPVAYAVTLRKDPRYAAWLEIPPAD